MNQDTYTFIIVVLGALVAALTWAVVRLGRDLRDALPPALVELFPIMFQLLEGLAARTPTQLDDELIAELRTLLERRNGNPPAAR
jgi:hypothetical protein